MARADHPILPWNLAIEPIIVEATTDTLHPATDVWPDDPTNIVFKPSFNQPAYVLMTITPNGRGKFGPLFEAEIRRIVQEELNR